MDSNLKREIILEHYQNPKNKGLIDDDKIYNCIAVNHTVYHPSDSYSEPYVVWFN